MFGDVIKKGRRPKAKVTMRPSDQIIKVRFDLMTAYKDGQDLLVQSERHNYEKPRPGRYDDGVPVRRATLTKPRVSE
jgi:hypothetical protein